MYATTTTTTTTTTGSASHSTPATRSRQSDPTLSQLANHKPAYQRISLKDILTSLSADIKVLPDQRSPHFCSSLLAVCHKLKKMSLH